MCLGIPARIIEIKESEPMRSGKVDFGGVTREISLAFVPEAKCDDYVIVHAGFAISLLDEKEANETLDLLAEIGILDDSPDAPLVADTSD
jgi:hydrogenase expression/formation protein HypC